MAPQNTPPPSPGVPVGYQALITDTEMWDMKDIAAALEVRYQTVKTWRRDAERNARVARMAGNRPHPNLLPPPHMIKTGKPLWQAGQVRLWAMQTGRMSADGRPVRSKPRGRPRRKPAA